MCLVKVTVGDAREGSRNVTGRHRYLDMEESFSTGSREES